MAKTLSRYAATISFYWQVGRKNKGAKAYYEIRIINLHASSPKAALKQAERYAKDGDFDYKNDEDKTVYFKFDQVIDVLELGPECGPDEVWYNVISERDFKKNKDTSLSGMLTALFHGKPKKSKTKKARAKRKKTSKAK